MVNVGTLGGTAQSTGGDKKQPTMANIIPFTRASRLHRESFIDETVTITTADQDLGSFDVPAYGFLRSIVLKVSVTQAAVGTVGVMNENAPFNVLKNIFFSEPNGGQIHQFPTGYQLYLADKFGGYRGFNDARSAPFFTNTLTTTGGTFSFILRIPIEINERTALGSLPNQNAAAMFKLRLAVASITDLLGAGWTQTTALIINIKAFIEAWDQPQANSPLGAQQTTPPCLNTTQSWSSQTYTVNSGQNTIRLTRVGNYIRELITIFREGTRTLGEAHIPDPTYIYFDTQLLDTVNDALYENQMWERGNYGHDGNAVETAEGQDNGVRVIDFCHEFAGGYGMELNDQWLYTLGSSRLEIAGNWSAAGTLEVLTNDISVTGNPFL